MPKKKDKKAVCMHDHKNAIKVGNVDYACQLCGNLLDPLEWFFMNSFEFVDVSVETQKEIGRSVVSKKNYPKEPENKKLTR